jgi:polyisoprenoid-binding protein YceI
MTPEELYAQGEEMLKKQTGFLIVVPALIVFALVLAACGSSQPEAAPPVEGAVEQTPAEEPMEEPAEEDPMEEAATGGPNFQVTDESEARFLIGEVLNGNAITVVGATNAVSGEIVADYADTSSAQVNQVRVDLSTLATDNNFRNRAIHDFILQTGDEANKFAEFTSTSITGLPASVTVGETYDVQINGNLTIHGVTQEVTFEGTIRPVSDTRIEGSASLMITYGDYGVQILRLPDQVASVEDVTTLEIDLVAVSG